MIDRIKEIIKTKFNTQTAFAEYLNISRQQVTRYLNNENLLPIPAIIKLANEYNINPTWLLLGKGNMLLSDNDSINNDELIKQLQEKINQLEIENNLLKELVKK